MTPCDEWVRRRKGFSGLRNHAGLVLRRILVESVAARQRPVFSEATRVIFCVLQADLHCIIDAAGIPSAATDGRDDRDLRFDDAEIAGGKPQHGFAYD